MISLVLFLTGTTGIIYCTWVCTWVCVHGKCGSDVVYGHIRGGSSCGPWVYFKLCWKEKKKANKNRKFFCKMDCTMLPHTTLTQISPKSRFRDKPNFSVMLYNIIAEKSHSLLQLRVSTYKEAPQMQRSHDIWWMRSVCPVVQLLDYFGSKVRQGIKGDEVITLNDLEIRDTVSIPATPLASFHRGGLASPSHQSLSVCAETFWRPCLLCPTFGFNQY